MAKTAVLIFGKIARPPVNGLCAGGSPLVLQRGNYRGSIPKERRRMGSWTFVVGYLT